MAGTPISSNNPPDVPTLGTSGDASKIERQITIGRPPSQTTFSSEHPSRTNGVQLTDRSVSIWQSLKEIKFFKAIINFFSKTPASNPAPAIPDPASAAPVPAQTITVYAKNPETIDAIQRNLAQPGLMSEEEINAQIDVLREKLTSLGFNAAAKDGVASGLIMAAMQTQGHITGNEAKRQEEIREGKTTEEASPFQSCQPPDQDRIAGSKAFAELNSLIKFINQCAKECTGENHNSRKVKNARKEIMKKLVAICGDSTLQVATLERCIGGNNLEAGCRIYSPLLAGADVALRKCLVDENNNITAVGLKALAEAYGQDLVDQMVQTLYKTSRFSRDELKLAYEAYYETARKGEKCPDLDKLLFQGQGKLKDMVKAYKAKIQTIKSAPDSTSEGQQQEIDQYQKNMAPAFRDWLERHKVDNGDDSVTVDLGHIKIMVNAEQLDQVTLESLLAL